MIIILITLSAIKASMNYQIILFICERVYVAFQQNK